MKKIIILFAVCFLSSCSIYNKKNNYNESKTERKTNFFNHLKWITLGMLESMKEDQERKHNGGTSRNNPSSENPLDKISI